MSEREREDVDGMKVTFYGGEEDKSVKVQWNHAWFGVRGVSKRTGSNPVLGPSVGWASSLGANGFLEGGL
ncbi:hypothetical protein E2C01_055729 [Portunus trituberculatus]|uniref:Uncharacterized protein n=1 Tax=Portunus trituberculatus TaxID=210409 RepID=A0A5B7GWC3_PORTR|nr:hypothetical protein [Portunus trituberculatus]